MNSNPEYLNDPYKEKQAIETSSQGSGLEQVKQTVSTKLRDAAEVVRQKATTDPRDNMQGLGRQASDWLNRSADYVDEFNPQQVKENISDQVRRNPGRSLLIAGAAGLILGAILRRR